MQAVIFAAGTENSAGTDLSDFDQSASVVVAGTQNWANAGNT